MSNDLSNQLRSLNTFEWMARPATTKQICFDAADHIEKLEAALREIAQTVTIKDENWHPSYHDFSFTQTQAEGMSEALAARLMIARKALKVEND